MTRKRALFAGMTAAGLVVGLAGVQFIPTRPVAPEEPAWRKFAAVATASPDPTFSYAGFLPDYGSPPLRLPSWGEWEAEAMPEAEPLPELEPELAIAADQPWQEAQAEYLPDYPPDLEPPLPVPVLARTGPREVLIVSGPLSPETDEPDLSGGAPPADPEDEAEPAYGG